MSKWTIGGVKDNLICEDLDPIAQACDAEQAARIVALLNEGEADKRRLDWLEGNGSSRLDVSTDGNPLERNDGSNPLERWPWRRIAWREAINRAIAASESEPAGARKP